MLDFRIKTFLIVCKYMNFTQAARELHMSQPAVSQHIKYLEDFFETSLFNYEKRKLTLTPAGKLLLSSATTINQDQTKLLKKIEAIKTQKKHLIFGATLTIGEYVLPEKLANYKDSFTLLIQDTKTLLRYLDEGIIDFAFVEGYFPKQDYDYITWSTQKLVAIQSQDNPIFSNGPYDLLELVDCPLIIREKGSGTRDTLEHFLACENTHIEDFNSVIEVGGMEAIKTMVGLGMGITFLYKAAIEKNTNLKIIPLNRTFENDFSFIFRKGSIYESEYRDFFNQITK